MKSASDFPPETVEIIFESLAQETDRTEADLRTTFADTDTTLEEGGIDPDAIANFRFFLRKFYGVEIPRPPNGEYGTCKLSDILTLAAQPA